MSKGALSLVLLVGTVNAGCARGPQSLAAGAPLAVQSERSKDAPEQVWSAKAGKRLTGQLVVAGETIYGAGVDRKVYAVDLASGKPLWSSRLGGVIGGGVVVAGDTVFAATSRPEGKVHALDGRTGKRYWRTTTGAVSAPLALVDSILVAESQKGDIVGLDPKSGQLRWHRRLGVSRVPAVPTKGGTMVVATVDSLFRMQARDGKVLRRESSPGTVVSPWISHHGLLVAGTTDSLVVAVDPDSLETRWRVRLDAPVLTSPASSGDTLYAVSRRGSFYRIVGDPTPRAERLADLDWPVTAPVTVVDGVILLGGADGTLRAFHPDGKEAWRLQLRWPVELGVTLVDGGMLAVGGDGDVHRYRR
jgi:outer membrane protein assembly factor BamB